MTKLGVVFLASSLTAVVADLWEFPSPANAEAGLLVVATECDQPPRASGRQAMDENGGVAFVSEASLRPVRGELARRKAGLVVAIPGTLVPQTCDGSWAR